MELQMKMETTGHHPRSVEPCSETYRTSDTPLPRGADVAANLLPSSAQLQVSTNSPLSTRTLCFASSSQTSNININISINLALTMWTRGPRQLQSNKAGPNTRCQVSDPALARYRHRLRSADAPCRNASNSGITLTNAPTPDHTRPVRPAPSSSRWAVVLCGTNRLWKCRRSSRSMPGWGWRIRS
jgi:hypothetical protein